LWHIPRTQDWLVQTVVRGEPEIVESFRDGLPDPDRFGFGTGLTPEQAREAAAAVDVPTMLAYADAVTARIDEWLSGLAESDLDEVPDLIARQAARPAYGTPEALAEAQGLIGVPVGVLMLRPVTSHCVMHFGEIDILSQVAAAR
jgi:hypothetical protein